MAQLRVIVLDRQRTFADALAARLGREDDLTVTGVVLPARPDPSRVFAEPADIVLLDADLPGEAAFSLCAQISGRSQPPRVITLSDSSEPERIVRAIRAGAAAWVRKDETIEQLLRVLRGVASGDMWLPPADLRQVLQLLLSQQDERRAADELFASLTTREQEVLLRLAEGFGRRDVAKQLHVSCNTIRTHLQNLMGKLGVHSTLEAVAMARSRPRGPPI